MLNKTNYFKLIWLFTAFWVISCNSTDSPQPENKYLIDAEIVSSIKSDEFKKSLSQTIGAGFDLFVRSGIDQYRLTYKTTNTDGTEIIASGALIIPNEIDNELALISYQHGTIFNEKDAPSYFNSASESTLGAFFASNGFIVAMPDYIGYGASAELPHPYEHKDGLAQPNVDFLLAVKEFISSENIKWNKKTMLGGYSQGGFATMATLKLIEESYANEFNIVAVSCGAGAYDKTGTFNQFLNEGTSGEISNNQSYIWVLLTYDRIYKLNNPLSYYFIEPYRTMIENNGFRVSINKSINLVISQMVANDFKNKRNPSLVAAVADNDVYDWKPNSEIKLFHGTADTYVPVENSKKAFDAMKARGASRVSLDLIQGGTHSSTVGDFFLQTFTYFNQKK